jgi:hypothetical protein
MSLSILEADFLGDLSVDTHGVWEIFESARLHYPGRDDAEVFKIGEEYLSRWIERGWIAVADRPLYPTQVKSMFEVRAFVQEHGVASTTYIGGAPSLDITETGIRALPKTPNQTP